MINVFYLILSILLRYWPLKYRVHGVKRSGSDVDRESVRLGQAVEYAVWLPFLGWITAWAVFLGPGEFPRWRVIRFQRDIGRSRGRWPGGKKRECDPPMGSSRKSSRE